jgi:hypothetical protein
LLATVVIVLAATVATSLVHEMRPRTVPQAAVAQEAVALAAVPTPAKPQLPALSAEEESYAAALWGIQREVTPAAVAMSFAGIAYQTETHDERQLAQRVEPLSKFFRDAETRVRALGAPPSLANVKEQYAGAMVLYADAAGEMLRFVEDGRMQHLTDAHRMDIDASETLLRVGEVLWPGQYKPN